MITHLYATHKETALADREHWSRAVHLPEGLPHVRLQTCNRVELFWGEGDVGEETLRHLCRVACGLESGLLGERAVQGQVKKAYGEACARFRLSGTLHRMFQTALRAGKRVRSETALSQGAVSHAQVAAAAILSKHSDPSGRVIVMVGVNKMSEDIMKFLVRRGAAGIWLTNRNFAKAEAAARRFDCGVVSFSERSRILACADVVVCAISAPHPVITAQDLPSGRNVSVFDLSFPRNVEPAAAALPYVDYYDLERMEGGVEKNLGMRREAVVQAERIIGEEIEKFRKWNAARPCKEYRDEKTVIGKGVPGGL